MSTLLANRVQSAYPRSTRRSSSMQVSRVKQRPVSSLATHRSHADAFDVPSWRTSSSSTPLDITSNRQRPKTASISSSTNLPFPVGQLQKHEVKSLLRSLDREDTFIVQVNCLADYRKLVQSINLRQTPIDHKSLCALQQRENRIVQRNACRDARFRSLMEALSPAHRLKVPENDSNDAKHSNV